MDMGVDESGEYIFSRRIDGFLCLNVEVFPDLCDGFVLAIDICDTAIVSRYDFAVSDQKRHTFIMH